MKATLVSLIFAAGALAQNSFTINTPSNAVVCQPLLISWTGGTPPYFLSVLPGADPTGQALVDLGQQNGTSFTWTVNQQANTQLGLILRDSNGLVAQSAPFTVNSGPDSSCVGKPATGSAGTAAPPATTRGATPPASSGGGVTTPASTGAAATSAGASATSNRPTSTSGRPSSAASSGASTTSNAASSNLAHVGAAGVVGAALAALLA